MHNMECSYSGCDRKTVAKNLCSGHWRQQARGQELRPLRRRVFDAKCEISGCGRKHRAHGLCGAHLERQRRGVPLDAPVREVFETDDLHERLRRYAPAGKPDECWEWTRATNKGYGMIAIGEGKLRGAHIIAWELANGRALPSDSLIRHTCDNPPCTNPSHLLVGKHIDNSRDRVEHGKPNKGERNPQAKLTADDVRTIRRLAASGAGQQAIADRFQVSQSAVHLIVAKKTWKHL